MVLYIAGGCLGFLNHQHQQNSFNFFHKALAFQSLPVWSSSHCFVSSNVDANLHVSAGLILSSHKMGTRMGDFLHPLAWKGEWIPILDILPWRQKLLANFDNRELLMTWGIFWISVSKETSTVTQKKRHDQYINSTTTATGDDKNLCQ